MPPGRPRDATSHVTFCTRLAENAVRGLHGGLHVVRLSNEGA